MKRYRQLLLLIADAEAHESSEASFNILPSVVNTMNTLEILTRQTEDAYQWTNKLIHDIPHDAWDTTPDILESNISWQVGHLIMSFYYHSVMCIAGHQPDIFEQVPIKTYAALFTYDALPGNAAGKTKPEDLQAHLDLME